MTDNIETFLKGTTNTLKEQQKDVDVYLPIVLNEEDYQQSLDPQGKLDSTKFYSRCILKAAETYQDGEHGTAIYTSQTKEYKRRTERAFHQFMQTDPNNGKPQYRCIVMVKPIGQSKIHGQNKRSRGLTPVMLKNLANNFSGIILDNNFPGIKQLKEVN